MKYLATPIAVAFIYWLFRMDRHGERRASWTLWLPIVWFAIICSRPVSFWLQPDRGADLMGRFTESSPLDAAIYGLLIAAGLFGLNRRAPRVRQFLKINLPVLLFFLYCLLSLMWSDDPMVGFKRWFKAAGDVVMVLLVLTDADPEYAINRLYTRAGFVLLPLSVLFIFAYPQLGTTYDPGEHVTMYTGVATFKNLLGVLCMACGLGALWSLLGALHDRAMANRNRHLIAQGMAFLLSVALVIRADSMTSLSSFFLASVVMIAASLAWVQRRPPALIAVSLATVAAAGFALFLSSGAGILQSIGRNSTLTGRTMIWKAVLAQPINPLTGAGFESFWMGNRMESVWSMSQRGIQQAHDGYLELYLNLGWIGLALLAVLIVAGYRNSLALYRRDPHAGTLRIALLTAAVVYAFTEAGFRMMSPDWFGFLLAATAMPLLPPPEMKSTIARGLQNTQQQKQVHILR